MDRIKFKAFLSFVMITFIFGCLNEKGNEIEGMVYISSGEFVLGSDDVDPSGLGKEFGARQTTFYEDERPIRKMNLDSFYIDKFEVNNRDFKNFCNKKGYPPPPTWENGMYIAGQALHPVENVSWFDANEYCKWAKKRLPSEIEWEKAARGPKANRYPWGMDFDKDKANFGLGDTVPGGSIPTDKSYYGAFDMGGNVMEWTSSWYKPYPGSTVKSKDFGEQYRILRGGSGTVVGHYNLSKIYSRSAYRHYYLPGGRGNDSGFRCAKDG
jgi:formylglycine-generating enzyme required for sulfatase activity